MTPCTAPFIRGLQKFRRRRRIRGVYEITHFRTQRIRNVHLESVFLGKYFFNHSTLFGFQKTRQYLEVTSFIIA